MAGTPSVPLFSLRATESAVCVPIRPGKAAPNRLFRIEPIAALQRIDGILHKVGILNHGKVRLVIGPCKNSLRAGIETPVAKVHRGIDAHFQHIAAALQNKTHRTLIAAVGRRRSVEHRAVRPADIMARTAPRGKRRTLEAVPCGDRHILKRNQVHMGVKAHAVEKEPVTFAQHLASRTVGFFGIVRLHIIGPDRLDPLAVALRVRDFPAVGEKLELRTARGRRAAGAGIGIFVIAAGKNGRSLRRRRRYPILPP